MIIASWIKWLPWRYAVRRIARAQGFIDPIAVLSRFHGLQQPSEVAEPLELLRAGVVFHARGLLNTKVIQHNLDWIWPYWVEKQFDPEDPSFIPRAFSITHVNLTHRNWTAVGVPDSDKYAVVDPRGLIMPWWDSWSIDAWVQNTERDMLIPSRAGAAEQRLLFEDNLQVETVSAASGMRLISTAEVENTADGNIARLTLEAASESGGSLIVSLRPYNPEGVSFIESIEAVDTGFNWLVNGKERVRFREPPAHQLFSNYHAGDVYSLIQHREPSEGAKAIDCRVGLATAAAIYRLSPQTTRKVIVEIPLEQAPGSKKISAQNLWQAALEDSCELNIPDVKLKYLWDAAQRTLVLLSPSETYPGPYTYKRFWFRDAVFIVHGLLLAGLHRRAWRVMETFPRHQRVNGYFLSQEGEWDSNGQVLWILERYTELTDHALPEAWKKIIVKAADWIIRKRTSPDLDAPHAGLLPAGFSAEHLGPNDFYYWDDFWGVRGLQSASVLMQEFGDTQRAAEYAAQSVAFMNAIEKSFTRLRVDPLVDGIPASPYRRMDAGAIGSIAAGYPLELFEPRDRRLMASIETILKNFFVKGLFFQDMIHSGLNAYLTLQVAQILLRAEDPRSYQLLQSVAHIASPTGQWPEANHPLTLGGCMGDGQHAWAAAELIALVRNCFVLETKSSLIVGSGIPRAWLAAQNEMTCGPTLTKFGPVTVKIRGTAHGAEVEVRGDWHNIAPPIEVRIIGLPMQYLEPEIGKLSVG